MEPNQDLPEVLLGPEGKIILNKLDEYEIDHDTISNKHFTD